MVKTGLESVNDYEIYQKSWRSNLSLWLQTNRTWFIRPEGKLIRMEKYLKILQRFNVSLCLKFRTGC